MDKTTQFVVIYVKETKDICVLLSNGKEMFYSKFNYLTSYLLETITSGFSNSK